jgi:uncharacterized protein (TIGR00730 family)
MPPDACARLPAVPSRLCVYCGSNAGASPAYLEAARQLGEAMTNRGIGLVYGGGNVGLMGALADTVLAAGGEVIGVIPEQLTRAEVAHGTLTDLHVVGTMHERKALMADLADAFVALPGGLGTFEEVLEVLTWNQLRLISKPVVLLDVEGYFAPLAAMLDCAVEAGFVRPAHRMLAQRAQTVEEAIALALAPVPETPHKWLDRDS